MAVYDRALITGGGGMLASALIGQLRQRGIEPLAPSHAELDVSQDSGTVIGIVLAHKPTLIINCAAFTKVDACEVEQQIALRVNGFAPSKLSAAAGAIGAKFVHYSTDFVFDGGATRPYQPEDPVNPLSVYGSTKQFGERMIQRAQGVDWIIIRTAWLYGPGGPCFPQSILNAARAGKPLNVVDDQVGSPTFTNDLAQATLELIDKRAQGIWHVVNDGQTSWHGFAAAILEEFKVDAKLSRTTSSEWKKSRPTSATRPAYSVLDISPFEKLTGHRTRHWREALREYASIVETG
jgi:dTDP-4-dehydrorhamnose reductase